MGRHGQPKLFGIARTSDFVALGQQVVGQFVDKKSFVVEKNLSTHISGTTVKSKNDSADAKETQCSRTDRFLQRHGSKAEKY